MGIFALKILLIVSLSVFRLSDARACVHVPAAPVLIQYFKLNTGCQDGPLCKTWKCSREFVTFIDKDMTVN